jgi:integrase
MAIRNLPQLKGLITLSDWADRWMTTGTPQYWTPATREKVDSILYTWVLPALGSLLLTEISGDHLQQLLRLWHESGVGPNTIRNRYFTLKGMFGDARRERYLSRNPCADIPIPPALARPSFTWTKELVRKQLRALRGTSVEDIALLILGSAIRPTELYAARIEDFNPHESSLYIRYPGRYVTARRTIVLPAFAVGAFLRLSSTALQKGSSLAWSMRDARPCNQNYMSQQFKTCLRGKGVPTMRNTEWRTAFGFLATEGAVSQAIIDHYVKMRPRGPRPLLNHLHDAAARLDAVYRGLAPLERGNIGVGDSDPTQPNRV